MSVSYSAGQYEQEFTPKRLGMYELPKESLSKAPRSNSSVTDFIADNKGRLLQGVSKGESNPFGDFVGTWDLPKSIPGPTVKINPTARSNKNFENLNNKKAQTEDAIKRAQETQKPIHLRKNIESKSSHNNNNSSFDKIISYSPEQNVATSNSHYHEGQDTNRSGEKESPRD